MRNIIYIIGLIVVVLFILFAVRAALSGSLRIEALVLKYQC